MISDLEKSIEDRKKLREKLLEEIYEDYFEKKSKSKIYDLEKITTEEYMAFKYFEHKTYVFLDKAKENSVELQLTLTGLEFIENGFRE